VQGGRVQTALGEAQDPHCTISTRPRTLARLLSGETTPKVIVASDLRLRGPQSCLARFLNAFS